MLIDITAQTDAEISTEWIRKLTETVLERERHSPEHLVSIIFVDDAFITDLNRAYFQKSHATDVISFVLENGPFPGEKESAWGEVYISVERARQQAEDYQVTYQEELARLIVHGLLHLLGYEDGSPSEKAEMTRMENLYLASLQSHTS